MIDSEGRLRDLSKVVSNIGPNELSPRGLKMLSKVKPETLPIVNGNPGTNPETIATAIRIGNPASWVPALEVIHESLGDIRAVTDEEILDAYRYVARYESIFCEPASAASVAGIMKFGVPKGATVVCVLTGNGLKDPDTAVTTSAKPPVVDASLSALLATLS